MPMMPNVKADWYVL